MYIYKGSSWSLDVPFVCIDVTPIQANGYFESLAGSPSGQRWGPHDHLADSKFAKIYRKPTNKVYFASLAGSPTGQRCGQHDHLAGHLADPKSTKKQIHVEIDAGKFRGATYYINHACKDSNLEVVQFCDASRQLQLDSSGKIIPFRRNLFVTRKKINEGEELTFVYEKKGGRGSTNTFLDGKDCYCTHCCNKRGFD